MIIITKYENKRMMIGSSPHLTSEREHPSKSGAPVWWCDTRSQERGMQKHWRFEKLQKFVEINFESEHRTRKFSRQNQKILREITIDFRANGSFQNSFARNNLEFFWKFLADFFWSNVQIEKYLHELFQLYECLMFLYPSLQRRQMLRAKRAELAQKFVCAVCRRERAAAGRERIALFFVKKPRRKRNFFADSSSFNSIVCACVCLSFSLCESLWPPTKSWSSKAPHKIWPGKDNLSFGRPGSLPLYCGLITLDHGSAILLIPNTYIETQLILMGIVLEGDFFFYRGIIDPILPLCV